MPTTKSRADDLKRFFSFEGRAHRVVARHCRRLACRRPLVLAGGEVGAVVGDWHRHGPAAGGLIRSCIRLAGSCDERAAAARHGPLGMVGGVVLLAERARAACGNGLARVLRRYARRQPLRAESACDETMYTGMSLNASRFATRERRPARFADAPSRCGARPLFSALRLVARRQMRAGRDVSMAARKDLRAQSCVSRSDLR